MPTSRRLMRQLRRWSAWVPRLNLSITLSNAYALAGLSIRTRSPAGIAFPCLVRLAVRLLDLGQVNRFACSTTASSENLRSLKCAGPRSECALFASHRPAAPNLNKFYSAKNLLISVNIIRLSARNATSIV